MEVSESIKSYLTDYDMFKNISYIDILHSSKNQLISFTKTEYQNKHYYTRKLNNSTFSELIIMFDENTQQTSLTYIAQLTGEKIKTLQPLFQELYNLAKLEYIALEEKAEFVSNNKFIWAYTYVNGKLALGI